MNKMKAQERIHVLIILTRSSKLNSFLLYGPQTFLYALDECTRENTDYSNLVEYIKKIKRADVHVENTPGCLPSFVIVFSEAKRSLDLV